MANVIQTLLAACFIAVMLTPATPGQASGGALGARALTLPGGRVVFSKPGLRISEVSPGPRLSYVEVYNDSDSSISLDGYSIESATGVHDLTGMPSDLGPDEYFVLLQGHPFEVGVSTDPNTHAVIIDEPTCGHIGDTVLLRASDGSLVDAVCYGNQPDSSARYADAVSSGELGAGSFVDTSAEFVELVIGRDALSVDTDTMSDWGVSGGVDALVGSPFSRNVAFPDGPETWVPFYQAFASSVMAQPYYGLEVVTGSFESFNGSTTNSSVTHSLVLRGALLGSEDMTISGVVSNVLSTGSGHSYVMTSSGVLANPVGDGSLIFSVTRETAGSLDRIEIVADLVIGGISHPYRMTSLRQFSGVRGDFIHDIGRELVGWSGVPKVTNGIQHVVWELSASGTISTIDSTATYTRPYPLSDGWVGGVGGVPEPILTQETGYIDMTTVMTSDGPVTTWTRYEQDFANGNPSIVGDGIISIVSPQWVGGIKGLEAHVAGSIGGNGQMFQFSLSTRAEGLAGGKLNHVVNSGDIGGVPLALGEFSFDPPPPVFGGFWEGLTEAVTVGAKIMGSAAMYAIGAVGCVGTTVGGAAIGGGVTVATLGTATPAGVLAGGAGVTACAGLIKGADVVAGEIWEAGG